MFHANPSSKDTINELEIQQSSSLCMHVTHKFSNIWIETYQSIQLYLKRCQDGPIMKGWIIRYLKANLVPQHN